MGVSPASGRLADLSHTLRHPRCVQSRIAADCTGMTGNRVARIALSAVFVALLAAPVIFKQISTRATATVASTDAKRSSLARHGFYLQEAARTSGIDFVHQPPKLDRVLDPIMPEMASLGAAVSIVDYDRDGFADIYVVNSAEGSKNALYRNQGDGTFKDVAPELGIADVNRTGTGV